MILGVFTSYPVPPRLKKVAGLYGKEIKYISWNRKGTAAAASPDDYDILDEPGSRGFKRYLSLFKFREMVKNAIEKLQPEYIVCRFWPSFFIVRTIKTRAVIVYDVCDMPGKKLVVWLEHLLIRRRDKVTLASRFFADCYQDCSFQVYENRVNRLPAVEKSSSDKLRVTFLGIVRYSEILKNLIAATLHNDKIEVRIWGFGNDFDTIQNYIAETGSSAKLMGPYSGADIPAIYSRTDVVWCAYPSKQRNVKVAISNKFFESLAYRTPGIFSSDTKLGDLVTEKHIGYTVDPYSVPAIKTLLNETVSSRSMNDIVSNMERCDEKIYWDEYVAEETAR